MTSSQNSPYPEPKSLTPPSLADAAWLRKAGTQAVFRALADAGYPARVVGGAVRNALLAQPVKDIDFATTARPEEVVALAAAAGLRTVPTGLAHGTVTVLAGHEAFEVTTLREDVETFGRHAHIAFTEDWGADARRRDFTINALYCDAIGTVSDPLGGYPDLLARRVRFIGDAGDRIREDYLRILRFFRFHAEYALGPVDGPGLDACVREKAGMERLSGERIRSELMRLLAAPGAVGCVQVMAERGILQVALGMAPTVELFAGLARIEEAIGQPPDPILRLAALVLPANDPAMLKRRLKLSSAEADRLTCLAAGIPGLGPTMSESEAKVAIYRHGAATFADALKLAWARSEAATDDRNWIALLGIADSWVPPVLPVRGADLLARGMKPGPQVGQLLAALEDWWVAEGFPADAARIEKQVIELTALLPDQRSA